MLFFLLSIFSVCAKRKKKQQRPIELHKNTHTETHIYIQKHISSVLFRPVNFSECKFYLFFVCKFFFIFWKRCYNILIIYIIFLPKKVVNMNSSKYIFKENRCVYIWNNNKKKLTKASERIAKRILFWIFIFSLFHSNEETRKKADNKNIQLSLRVRHKTISIILELFINFIAKAIPKWDMMLFGYRQRIKKIYIIIQTGAVLLWCDVLCCVDNRYHITSLE